MREAIKTGGFELHYQPQVRVHDGKVIGVEALIRWPQKDAPGSSPTTSFRWPSSAA
jgi:sensor c-di-GMP phosphodiesterase-like protein